MEFLPLGAIRPHERAGCAIMHAECAGTSGLGYYATGPLLDVQDVPRQVRAVLYVCLWAWVDCRTRGWERSG